MSQGTAEIVFKNFLQLTTNERAKFFALLAESSIQAQDFSHEQVFGHLAGAEFTASEAADYLGVSMSTFRRYAAQGKIQASSEVGRSQLFATKDLKAFKRSLQDVRSHLKVANATTLAAFDEAEEIIKRKRARFGSAEDLMNDLEEKVGK